MILFPILDEADQQFGAIMSGRRCTLRLRYNPTTDRWSFDLSIDNLPVLYGRRLVRGVDLLAPFNFGIGALFVWGPNDEVPNRQALPNGVVGFYSATDAEVEAAS